MIIWKNTFPDFNHTAIFCRLNCGHPGVFSWYSPWCSTRMVDRPQVWLEAEEKNGAKDSPSICPGVERRPAISKNVGAKSMFITCSCYLISIVINIYVANSFLPLSIIPKTESWVVSSWEDVNHAIDLIDFSLYKPCIVSASTMHELIDLIFTL